MNIRLLLFLLVVLGFGGLLFFVKTSNNTSTQTTFGKKLEVTASFYPLYFFAQQIGKDKVNVNSITPASAEPHDYEPTSQQIARIETSNLLILNGGSLEAWGNKIKDDVQGKNVLVVEAGQGLTTKQIQENGKTIIDPHVWLDPILAKQEVEKIKQGFEQLDPQNKTYYETNATTFEYKLDQLDQEYKAGLKSCVQKDIVTSHAAFGYLAARYGLNQIAIAGVSPDAEPSPQKLAEITNIVKQKHINVIFFESLVSPKLSQTVAKETGAQTMVLDPIEGVTPDELKTGQNYLTLMHQNLINLQQALQCRK